MFKQVIKKIGVIFLALILLILDLTLLGAFPLLTQDGISKSGAYFRQTSFPPTYSGW